MCETLNADNSIGLNFNCVEGVVPSCTSADNPPKYEPISCGDCKYTHLRSLQSVLILSQGVSYDSNARQMNSKREML